MNKFIILALVALSANVASAQFSMNEGVGDEYSEALIPTDTEEVSYLKPHEKIFGSFCTQARDDVKVFFNNQANAAAAGLYSAFFKGVGESGDAMLHMQKSAVDEAAKAIKDNVAPPSAVPTNAAEAQKSVEETAEQVSLISNVSKGAKFVLNTVVDVARSELSARIALVKAQFATGNLKEQMVDLCNSVSMELKKNLGKRFTQFKSEAKSTAGSFNVDPALLETVTVDNLGCLTTGRINKVAQVCSFFSFAGPAMLQIFGLA